MSGVQVLVNVLGLGLVALIAWYFWFSKKPAVRAAVVDGVQEVNITVKGGYTPDVILVKAGRPVRLNFTRAETAACTEMVVFGDFGKSAQLPTGQTVPVDLLPQHPGEYEFACQMGMIRGKLIVE